MFSYLESASSHPKNLELNKFFKSVFGWKNLKFWKILNSKNFKYFNWNFFIFKILCLDKKKLKLWGRKKMNEKKRKDMIGVLVIHVQIRLIVHNLIRCFFTKNIQTMNSRLQKFKFSDKLLSLDKILYPNWSLFDNSLKMQFTNFTTSHQQMPSKNYIFEYKRDKVFFNAL